LAASTPAIRGAPSGSPVSVKHSALREAIRSAASFSSAPAAGVGVGATYGVGVERGPARPSLEKALQVWKRDS
jgi:hypothetical protein